MLHLFSNYSLINFSAACDRKLMVYLQTHRRLSVSQTELKVQQVFWLDAQL